MGELQDVLDALGSPIRREILWLVWTEERTVGEIGAAFDLQAPTISAHLTVLRRAGLVKLRADGNFRRYLAEQAALRSVQRLLFDESQRWTAADDLPERALASARSHPGVTVSVEVEHPVAEVFRAFVDPELYSAWLGVPARLDGQRFAATMEWGTEVRGTYEVVVPPTLIAMRWTLADGAVPLPGDELPGYLRFDPTASGGTRVVMHQLVDHAAQAPFMEAAWSMVLGRLKEGLGAALADAGQAVRRASRPKHRADTVSPQRGS